MGFVERFISCVNSYKKVFRKDDYDVKKVLADMGRFAPVDPTTKCVKPYKDNEIYIMIGRRQMFSYILGKINMTQEEINNLIKQEQLKKQQEQQNM